MATDGRLLWVKNRMGSTVFDENTRPCAASCFLNELQYFTVLWFLHPVSLRYILQKTHELTVHPRVFHGFQFQFSCQAAGDFALHEAGSGTAVHAHFKKLNPLVSLVSAVQAVAVSAGPGGSVVELAIPDGASALVLLIDGVEIIMADKYENSEFVVYSGPTYKMFVKSTSTSV